jgi:nicotinate-nucleotide pyrophosphorylase (carboxylating)
MIIDFNSDILTNQIHHWLNEDVGPGDYSSLASIDSNAQAESTLILKDNGVVAGLELAKSVFNVIDSSIQINVLASDGVYYEKGTILATAYGNAQSLLKGERLMLNLLQRLSGIATQTKVAVDMVERTGVKLLDTRKTTPGLRLLEKWAVTMGGGYNHRIGLYDMIMLKDNHIDSSGGITIAVNKTKAYLASKNLNLKIEVETRNLDEVKEALSVGVDRIMLDNFTPEQCKIAVELIGNQCETEASGGIGLHNLKEYALSGVTYISLGYFTHSVKALDISFKTKLKS